MASSKHGKERDAAVERERVRVYRARTQLHQAARRRRVRDNWTAGIVGGLLIAAAVGGQTAYYTAGPGAQETAPTTTPSPDSSILPTPDAPTSPELSPTPSPSATP